VSGQPLTKTLAAATSLADRLSLLPHLLDVAEAVAYAHSRGVIHRDLKPANVLVGEYGETVVIDWGLGKDLSDDDETDSIADSMPQPEGESLPQEGREELTRQGAVLGTPAYMPPEQARGERVGRTADVYALGAMLYHLLAGRAPYERGSSLEVLGQVLLGPPAPVTAWGARPPRELLAITTKAMARDPADRYPSAAQVAEDLRRYQTGQIVGAHRYSAWQRLQRWGWRHRTGVAAALAALLVLGVGGAYSVQQLREEVRNTERARAEAEQEAAAARRAQHEAEQASHRAIDRTDALRIETARIDAHRDPAAALATLAELSPRYDEWSRVQVIASDALAQGPARVLRPCEGAPSPWCLRDSVSSMMVHGDRVELLGRGGEVDAWDPATGRNLGPVIPARDVRLAARDGERLVTLQASGALREWSPGSTTPRELGRFDGPLRKLWTAAGGSAVGLASGDGSDALWHWAPGAAPRRLAECRRWSDQRYAPVAFSPRHEWVGCMSEASELVMFDLLGGRRRTVSSLVQPRSLALADDAEWAAWAGMSGPPVIWSAAEGRARVLDSPDARPFDATGVLFRPTTDELLVVAYDGRVARWAPGEARLGPGSAHQGAVTTATTSDDGTRLVTGAADGSVHVHDLESSRVRRLAGFEGMVLGAEVMPGSEAVVARGLDRTVRIWSLDREYGMSLARLPGRVEALAVDPAGARLWAGTDAGELWVLSADGSSEPRRLSTLDGPVKQLHVSPRGTRVAAGTEAGVVEVWGADAALVWREALGPGPVSGLSFSPDERMLTVAHYDRGVGTVELGRGELVLDGRARVAGAERLPDGRVLAWSHEGWVSVTGPGHEPLRRDYGDEVWVARALPEGRGVVFAGRDGRLRRLALPGGEVTEAVPTGLDVTHIEVLEGGEQLVTLGNDWRLRRWDAQTLEPLGTYQGHRAYVSGFSGGDPRGRLASASHDGSARLWDLATGEWRALEGHEGPVHTVVLGPKGDAVYTGGRDGTVRRWSDALPRGEHEMRAWLRGREGPER